MVDKCIFCAIVAKKIPSLTVYEDNDFMAFLDIRPLTKGNCLVIPKKHYHWAYDVPNFGEYFEVAKKVGLAAQQAFGAKWISFITLGLEVSHAHIRVIPRYEKDLHQVVVDINVFEKFNEQEMREIAQQIKNVLSDSSSERPVIVEHVKERKPRKPRSDIGTHRTKRKRTSGNEPNWLKRELAQT